MPLDAAGIKQMPGRSTRLIYQNVDPPYAMPDLHAMVRWMPGAPLRTSGIGASGKVANAVLTGRGIACVHYKHDETLVPWAWRWRSSARPDASE